MSSGFSITGILTVHQLPVPLWIPQDPPECSNHDPEVFFPAPRDHLGIAEAKSICRGCDHRLDCLAFALLCPALTGVWGGSTDAERNAYRRGRGPKILDRREDQPA